MVEVTRHIFSSVAFSTLAATLVACGASLGEYKKFADAGLKYTDAIDALLVSSASIYVEAGSERLLRNELQQPDEDLKTYNCTTEREKKWLLLIGRMREHADLLKRYFLALQELANSDSPVQARNTAESIFSQLSTIGATIGSSPLVLSSDKVKELAAIPELIISEQIKGGLRAELQARKAAIYKELLLQELVLQLLQAQIVADLRDIQSGRDDRLALRPYVSPEPIGNPDGWIQKRQAIRLLSVTSDSLGSATKASKQFKEAFELLLEDKFSLARANDLMSSINLLLKAVMTLKQS
jgi:hypothetical protein